ncbi:thiopurine S-methyltransferase [Hansschlegelia quercus]|uniref:Thiopurine S-methyltransferase n=1 Tax=Hansschlegelia quercus TaxID=2528245 RepID=A0A4Q9GJH6_9HYPH|nr:thiopurine S-methyltransferase [Hansschlegelia quercus]TBN54469.1 thiopurine S-methyltransferase [Hansschlegelia quercus]
MDADFWRARWREGRLGWHRADVNPLLARHLPALGLAPGARIFMPLCGKSRDIHWLLGEGFCVAGCELVETAVEQLFEELGVAPTIEDRGRLKLYRAEGVDIVVGDIFDLDAETLGRVEAVYDRAALVALPPETRKRYAAHVAAATACAPQILVTYVYDQSLIGGPPFSVTDEEVRALYAGAYDVTLLESADVEGGMKGRCPAIEHALALRHC